MARYGSYGQKDSRHGLEGDMSFIKLVTRTNPEELAPGDVSLSENGRMQDGKTWQVRKGLDRTIDSPDLWLSGASASTGRAIVEYTDPDTDITWLLSAGSSGVVAQQIYSSASTTAERLFLYLPETSSVEQGGMAATLGKVFLLNGSTSVPMKLEGGFENVGVTTIARAGNVVTITTASAHGYSTGDKVSVFNSSGISINPDGYWVIASTPTADTFTYAQVATGQAPTAQTSTVCGVCKTFETVSTSVTVATSDDDVSMTVVEGLCTISATAHGRSDGDILTVYDGGDSDLNNGDSYAIEYIDADSYSIFAEIPAGTYTVTLGGKQPISGGYVAMPKAKWGVFHENRMVLPYDSTGNAADTDELVYSDILDYETFDPIINQLRFATRSGDYVRSYIPITADRAIVLCTHSVHLVVGISGSLLDIERFEITREFGIVDRGSAVYANGKVIFLSPNGVVSISIENNYELFVSPIPLSDPIQDKILPYTKRKFFYQDRKSFAIFWDNRYYLFVSDDSQNYPNTVFIYNFLNGGWESIDDYPETYTDVVISEQLDSGDLTTGLYLQEANGNVFFMEKEDKNDDDTETTTSAISGKMETRGYQFGDMNVNRFTRASIILANEGLNLGVVTVTSLTEDADKNTVIYTGNAGGGSDFTIRPRIGDRGRNVRLRIESSIIKVRGCSVDAIVSSFNDVTRS